MGLTSRSTLPYHQPAPSPARDVITNSLDLNPNPQIDSVKPGCWGINAFTNSVLGHGDFPLGHTPRP